MTELKIMPIQLCGAIGKCMSSPQSYENDVNRFARKPDPVAVATHALRKLEEARAADVATHEANLPAIENNKAVRAAVETLMSSIGMPAKWTHKDAKSRSRFPKNITEESGYIGDLKRNVPVDDNFTNATVVYNSLKARYDEFASRADELAKQQRAEAERAAEKIKEERLANIEFAKILLRYGFDTSIEWPGVLEALRTKDKRLDLAIAMEDTRGDWSDGFYRVQSAVDRFPLETDQDKEILNDILPLLSRDYDQDGRCFRDTRWNYNALYALIEDQQLVTDCRLARERCRS